MIVWENRGLIKTHPKLRDPRRPQLLIVAFALGVVIIALATLARGPRALVILPALLFCATAWLSTAQPRSAKAVAVTAVCGVIVGFLLSLPIYGLFNRGENNRSCPARC